MKAINRFRPVKGPVGWLLGLWLGHSCWALPAIQSVDLQPTPLQVGDSFSLAVTASDVTQGTATVDFRPWSARILRVALTFQGSRWIGTGIIPSDLQPTPGTEATIKLLFFDAARRRAEQTIKVPVMLPSSGIHAVFDANSGILTVTGDNLDNAIAVSRDPAGNILVNGGAVPILGGIPTIANTVLIRVLGLGGRDQLSLDESNGALPKGELQGGPGDDTLTGASAADELFGGPGADTLNGRRGNDRLFGGEGVDTFPWNPGDGSDLIEGEDGVDTLVFNGANIAETIDLAANGTRLRFFRNIANVVMDVNGIEVVQFSARGGADNITVNDLSGTDVGQVDLDLSGVPGSGVGDGQPDSVDVSGSNAGEVLLVTGSPAELTVSGGPATVTVLGVEGASDRLIVRGLGGSDTISAAGMSAGLVNLVADGGAAADTLIGSRGDDVLFGGDGDDTFVWNPGDGSDVVEGQDGDDTLVFNGSGASEKLDFSSNGTRLRFFRDVANISMDVAGVETVQLSTVGGSDTVTVNELTSTGVTRVSIDLGVPAGSGIGDGEPDNVIIQGTSGDDAVVVSGLGAGIEVSGLSATVSVVGNEVANDVMTINSLAGADVVNASSLPAGRIGFVVNGGLGADVIFGTQGQDLLIGGDGNDALFGGGGDDTFVWNPGDDNDILEGQGGFDTLLFNGANISENINLLANGGRILFLRNIANVTMDANDVERVQFTARGGADTITISDLSGTDVGQVDLDLSGVPGSGVGDGQPDSVDVSGTNAGDMLLVTGSPAELTVSGGPATVTVLGVEGASDRLIVRGLGGSDTISAAGMSAGLVNLVADGGAAADTLIGSRGDDVLFGGDGDDTFVWNPGDGSDVVEGQDGDDTLVFNGSGASEKLDFSSNGTRLRFFRDVANISMDVAGVETVQLSTVGGSDTVTVNELTSTGVTRVSIDLGVPAGSGIGDGEPDNVIIQGTSGDDAVVVSGLGAGIEVSGLSATVSVVGNEVANDVMTINSLAGADVVNASSLPAGRIGFVVNGGLGADVIFGTQGQDLLIGGDGNDALFGGGGDDTFVWNPGDDNDTLEGQGGFDTLLFNGANISENINLLANGGRILFLRNIANVTMDANDVERVRFNAVGGSDTIVIDDLSGTDVSQIDLDLASPSGSNLGDNQPDNIIINATSGDDVIQLAGSAGQLTVIGLSARIDVAGAEAANDRVTVNALAGSDVIEASALDSTAIRLVGDGGQGDDILIGGEGSDTLLGGEGDDVLIGGPGQDVLDGGSGNNVVIQD